MGEVSDEAIEELMASMDQVEEPLRATFENIHQGYLVQALVRFLKAREGNVAKAHTMLLDCLNWRCENEVDNILSKPIIPAEIYGAVRDSQLIGLSGYSKVGLPIFAISVGLSTFDKASVNYYVQSHIQINEYRDRVILPSASRKYGRPITTCLKVLDMTGLSLCLPGGILRETLASQVISTVDDLNYPEKTNTYYVVNVPCIFSACWKVVKPLLQERTRRRVQVLSDCGRDDLLKIMDYNSLPHFCKGEGSGSLRTADGPESCYSLNHPFHQALYSYIKEQSIMHAPGEPIKPGSFHGALPKPDAEGIDIAKTIESELQKFGNGNGIGLPN